MNREENLRDYATNNSAQITESNKKLNAKRTALSSMILLACASRIVFRDLLALLLIHLPCLVSAGQEVVHAVTVCSEKYVPKGVIEHGALEFGVERRRKDVSSSICCLSSSPCPPSSVSPFSLDRPTDRSSIRPSVRQ